MTENDFPALHKTGLTAAGGNWGFNAPGPHLTEGEKHGTFQLGKIPELFHDKHRGGTHTPHKAAVPNDEKSRSFLLQSEVFLLH